MPRVSSESLIERVVPSVQGERVKALHLVVDGRDFVAVPADELKELYEIRVKFLEVQKIFTEDSR